MSFTADDFRTMAQRAPWKATREAMTTQADAAPVEPRKAPEKPEPARTSPDAPPVDVTVEVRTQTECNTGEQFWRKAKRATWQRGLVDAALRPLVLPALPVTVRLTRLAPGSLDEHDNLPSSMKHVVDHIADLYGVPDNDPRITWQPVQQEREKVGALRRRYAVRIEVSPC